MTNLLVIFIVNLMFLDALQQIEFLLLAIAHQSKYCLLITKTRGLKNKIFDESVDIFTYYSVFLFCRYENNPFL